MKKDKVLDEFKPKHVQPVVITDNLLSPVTTFRGQQIDLSDIVEKSSPLEVDSTFRTGNVVVPESEEWTDLKK
jgi:hypothetical protein